MSPLAFRIRPVLLAAFLSGMGWSGAVGATEMVDPLSSTYLIKLVVSLFIVIGLMFLVVWLLKRTGRFDGRARHYPMRVLTQMSIGQRERIILIEVGERQMLLGVAGGCVESLGWVDPPIEPEHVAASSMGHPDSPFGKLLQRQLHRRQANRKDRTDIEEGAANRQREPRVDGDAMDMVGEDIAVRRPDDANDRN